MKRTRRIWYYWSLAGIIICVVGIIVLRMTGEPNLHLAKPIIVLGLCVYFFIQERSKIKQDQQHNND